jgi:hydroxymethyl cephem carbamoyltransferase
MLVLALKPGHDGAIAAIEDSELLFSLEGEKDTFARYSLLTPTNVLDIAERLPRSPDVVALSGWLRAGAGYEGADVVMQRPGKWFGKATTMFSSSHERSHIMMAVGMAPRDSFPTRVVLCYEGILGNFYLLDDQWRVTRTIPVMSHVGNRYVSIFQLADPKSALSVGFGAGRDSGKLMALAAFADSAAPDPRIADTVERILTTPKLTPLNFNKEVYRDSPVHNAGVESDECKAAAALITKRIYDIFAAAAREHIPPGLPLYISGGCGLNCEWNMKWRTDGHFSSVFVPPCTNDSGSAIGTAIDALFAATGEPQIDWSVYSGLEFEWDTEPDPAVWKRRALDLAALADEIAAGKVVAWVQGRWEIGPRALGNRSLLAEPFKAETKDRLNEIKQREDYRPIAPCCRIEDAGIAFDADFEDPYMLYFRGIRMKELRAVTHVDGTARVQTVTKEQNSVLHDLLTAFAKRSGVGVLCNTSLNFKGRGFINRMSDLARYCERQGIDFVVGDAWFQRAEAV